jgi:hypothetical protein
VALGRPSDILKPNHTATLWQATSGTPH